MSQTFFAQFASDAQSALAAILDQSEDCIKLIDLDGGVAYMNDKGKLAMQIDDFSLIAGRSWDVLWPAEAAADIRKAIIDGRNGQSARFEGFCPTAKGEPRWWDVMVTPMRDDRGRVTRLLAISRDMTEQVRLREAAAARLADAERSAAVQTISASESRHRLKNLLAVIQAISALVARSSRDVVQFQTRFSQHLRGLAKAQDLLARSDVGDLDLGDVVTTALKSAGEDDRIVIEAMPVASVREEAIQIAALVFGELHTNALKHGALAREHGRVRVSIAREGDGARVLWVEDCGETIPSSPLEGGSGIALIMRMAALSGRGADIHLEPCGLSASFWLPTAAA